MAEGVVMKAMALVADAIGEGGAGSPTMRPGSVDFGQLFMALEVVERMSFEGRMAASGVADLIRRSELVTWARRPWIDSGFHAAQSYQL